MAGTGAAHTVADMPVPSPSRLLAAALLVTASATPLAAAATGLVSGAPTTAATPGALIAAGGAWLLTLTVTVPGGRPPRARRSRGGDESTARTGQALRTLAARHAPETPSADAADGPAEVALLTGDAGELVDGADFGQLLTGAELERLLRLDGPAAAASFTTDHDAPPAPRRQTTGSAPVRRADATEGPAAPVAAALDATALPVTPAPADVLDRLAAAWADRDADTLAAIADRVPALTTAAAVLAAAASGGAPTALTYLQTALDTGADPATDPALAGYREALTFTVALPELDLMCDVPADLPGLTAFLALGERASGDSDAAYAAILTAPSTPLVRVVRALLELEAGWYSRAVTTTWAPADGTEDPTESAAVEAALRTLEGQALLGLGDAAAALRPLDAALTILGDAAGPLARRARLARATARLDAGDSDGAWADASAVLRGNPGDVDAAALLKRL